jgi:hypothetical protein
MNLPKKKGGTGIADRINVKWEGRSVLQVDKIPRAGEVLGKGKSNREPLEPGARR